ncbi:hypothetical protein [Desulfobacca acetoxidans]
MISANMPNLICGTLRRSCANLNAYQYTSPSIPDKEWAIKIKGTADDLNSIFGKSMRYNVTPKYRFKEYQFAHDRWAVQRNFGRILELERECYNEAAPFLVRTGSKRKLISQYIILNNIRENSRQTIEPKQKFVPSQRLVDLVYNHMVRPDKEEILSLLSDLSSISTRANEKEIVKGIITDQIESLLTKLAKQTSYANEETIEIARDNRFTPEVCSELVDRLGLDVLEAPSVLKLLYDELTSFLLLSPRERIWGKFFAEDSTMRLEVKRDAFSLPKFPSIGDSRWLIT